MTKTAPFATRLRTALPARLAVPGKPFRRSRRIAAPRPVVPGVAADAGQQFAARLRAALPDRKA